MKTDRIGNTLKVAIVRRALGHVYQAVHLPEADQVKAQTGDWIVLGYILTILWTPIMVAIIHDAACRLGGMDGLADLKSSPTTKHR